MIETTDFRELAQLGRVYQDDKLEQFHRKAQAASACELFAG